LGLGDGVVDLVTGDEPLASGRDGPAAGDPRPESWCEQGLERPGAQPVGGRGHAVSSGVCSRYASGTTRQVRSRDASRVSPSALAATAWWTPVTVTVEARREMTSSRWVCRPRLIPTA